MLTDERLRMTYGLPSREEEIAQRDLLEKGKAAPIGEVRTWSGQKYVKY
jgi:hypothetical protein